MSRPIDSERGVATKQPDYMNQAVFKRSRLDPRAYFLPQHTRCLSGLWKFFYTTNPEDPGPASDDQAAWSTIQVPGHWQLQGWGHPHYTNIVFPFPCNPPNVPAENPTGIYETEFQIPAAWEDFDSGLSYRLRFEGVDSAFSVRIDDHVVGYSQGSRNAAEFDISDLINVGKGTKHILRAVVHQWSDGSYIEDQDMWWLSGIFRDVFLLAFPCTAHVEDFFCKSILDDDFKAGQLQVDLSYVATKDCQVNLVLLDLDYQKEYSSRTETLKSTTSEHKCELSLKNPKLWSPEHPNLYMLRIQIKSKQQVIQAIEHKVGFRRVSFHNGLLHLNGQPIFFRGVNRHDHHPQFGRAVPLDFIRKDLITMKQHNINAIRTSHYPNHPRLVQMASELGLMVIDEADLECHGTGIHGPTVPSDKPEWRDAYVERMKQLVHRDKNEPAVIMWSLGNESFFGQNHQEMYYFAKRYDGTRPVHYEGDHSFRASDVCSYMYSSIYDLADLAQEQNDNTAKPIILQEYAHAMGNGPGGLKEYLETFRKYRRLQGGFIWEWNNHGLSKDLGTGSSFYAYGGDFGDDPNDGNFVMDGLCNSAHAPSPGLTDLKQAYSPFRVKSDLKKFTISVEDLYGFEDFKQFECLWSVVRFTSYGEDVLRSGTEKLDKAIMKRSRIYTIDMATIRHLITTTVSEDRYLRVSIRQASKQNWCEANHEVAYADFVISKRKHTQLVQPFGQEKVPSIEESSNFLDVETASSRLRFDKIKGNFVSWKYRGLSLLADSGPDLTFWRGLTDNDKHGKAGDWYGHRLDKLIYSVRSICHKINDDSGFEIEICQDIAPAIYAWLFQVKIRYILNCNGSMDIHVQMRPQGPIPETIPRIGIEMTLPSALNQVQWFGLGPGQSYKDMKQAARIGVWENEVSSLNHMHEMPQESGNRTETRWLKVKGALDHKDVTLKATLQQNYTDTVVGKSTEKSLYDDSWTIIDHEGDSAPSRTLDTRSTGFDFHLSPYSSHALDRAQHPHELDDRESQGLILRLDADHHGLGSATCGPDTLDKYQLRTRAFDFSVHLEPSVV